MMQRHEALPLDVISKPNGYSGKTGMKSGYRESSSAQYGYV